MNVQVGNPVALYGGAGGIGVVIETSETGETHLVEFTDGAKVWCSMKNLTIRGLSITDRPICHGGVAGEA